MREVSISLIDILRRGTSWKREWGMKESTNGCRGYFLLIMMGRGTFGVVVEPIKRWQGESLLLRYSNWSECIIRFTRESNFHY